MKAQRLTNAIKQAILHNMEEKLFRKRRDDLEMRKRKLAEEAWRSMYTTEELKYIIADPGGFLPRNTAISIMIDGHRCEIPFGKAIPYAYRDYQRWPNMKIDSEHPLYSKYKDIERVGGEIDKEKRQLQETVASIMEKVTTLKRLKEEWPDVEEYLPQINPQTNLPALPMSALTDLVAQLREKAEA